MIKQTAEQNDTKKELNEFESGKAMPGYQHESSKDLVTNYINKGNRYVNLGDIDQAITYYLEALRQMPDSLPALYNLGTVLFDKGDIDQAIELYKKSIDITPDFPEGLYGLAKAIEKKGQVGTAMKYFRQALRLRPDFDEARRGLNNTCRTIVPLWHFSMMNDLMRNHAYELAIEKIVNKESVVLDIGTGSGLLAMYAARAGAKQVIACERIEPIAEKAKEIIRRNGFSNRITVLSKDSRNIVVGRDMPRPADVLIAEVFDVGLIGEGVIPTINDAYARLLAPGARCIPGRATIHGVLVDSQEIYEQGNVGEVSGFDLSEFNDFSSLSYFQTQLPSFSHRVLSNDFEVFSFDFNNHPIKSGQRKIPVKIIEDGICHCVVFWFRLFLADNVYLDIGRSVDSHWKQAVQLFMPAVPLKKNQEVLALAKHDCHEVRFNLGMPVKKRG